MLITKESNSLTNIIKTLPTNKYKQLYDFALFLAWQTKNNSHSALYNTSFEQVEANEVEKDFSIPTFKCNGLIQDFNREELYNTKI